MKAFLITVPLLLVAGLMVGTQYFAHYVRMTSYQDTVPSSVRTGIVVATGLDGRVTAGINKLVNNDADRLLISGVGKGVRKSDITRIVATSPDVRPFELDRKMTCCVDLGFDATDTIGNAIEAKAWAGQHHIDHIVVVTSDFHMPRTMVAFGQHFTPNQLTPSPVNTPWLQLDEDGFSSWWHTPERIHLMSLEMIKYLARVIAQIV